MFVSAEKPASVDPKTLVAAPPVAVRKADARTGNEKRVFVSQADAPACPACGSITVRCGACYKCENCGSTTGCG
jgi:ribonucleoside-diphosphate reductase alpha chain